MKKKLFLFSLLIPVLGVGALVLGANNYKGAAATSGAVSLWSENFESKQEGDKFGNYTVATLNGHKWAKDTEGGGVDIPAYTHSQDFSFSYLASYPNTDGYNYVEFRDLRGTKNNVEFSLHSAGNAFYTCLKWGGNEIDGTKSWEGGNGHYASGFYGTNEYNSIRFVKKGTNLAIYINGVRTTYYNLGLNNTVTSIWFADINLNNAYYTNFVYENWNNVTFDFPEYYETFENYKSGVNYRCNGDSFTANNGSLRGNKDYNENHLALMTYSTNTVIDYDFSITEKLANSYYVYSILGTSTKNLEFTCEIKSDGAWFLIKENGNVVWHSGEHGNNPEINVGTNHVQIAVVNDYVFAYVNNKMVGKYASSLSSIEYARVCQYGASDRVSYSNIQFKTIDNLTAANAYPTTFLTTTATECAALDVKETTWAGLETAYKAMSKPAIDYVFAHAQADTTGNFYDMNERYKFIVNKYGYTSFLADSNAQNAYVSNALLINENISSEIAFITITISVLSITAISLVLVRRKRKATK